jgi:hypothetical protein
MTRIREGARSASAVVHLVVLLTGGALFSGCGNSPPPPPAAAVPPSTTSEIAKPATKPGRAPINEEDFSHRLRKKNQKARAGQ